MKAKVKAAKLPKSKRGEKRHRAAALQNLAGKGVSREKVGLFEQLAAQEMDRLEVKYVLRKQVRPDPDQPRKTFDKDKLQELAESIKAVGIRQPIQVERLPGGGYKIVDGERRWRAAELAKVERIPVMVVDTSSPDWEKQKLAVQMVLNQQHENITALEEAAAYQKEIESGRHTAESLYPALGISRGTLFSRLALNRVHPDVRAALVAGKISTSIAGLMNMVPAKQLEGALEQVTGDEIDPPMSFRDTQEMIEREYAKQLKNALFDTKDAKLVGPKMEVVKLKDNVSTTKRVSGGACTDCPSRSGNIEGCGLKNPNVCTLPSCFAAKEAAHKKAVVAKAEGQGKKVLPLKESDRIWSPYGGPGQLNYGAPFVRPSMKCEEDGKGRNYQALLKELPEAVWALRQDGKLEELWPKEAVGKALKAKGHKFELEQETGSGRDWAKVNKEREERIAKLTAVGQIAKAELLEKAKAGKTDEPFLRLIALRVCDDYDWAQRHKCERFQDKVKYFGKLDEAGLRVCMVEAMGARQLVDYEGKGFKEEFGYLCEVYGVDLKRTPVDLTGNKAKEKEAK